MHRSWQFNYHFDFILICGDSIPRDYVAQNFTLSDHEFTLVRIKTNAVESTLLEDKFQMIYMLKSIHRMNT